MMCIKVQKRVCNEYKIIHCHVLFWINNHYLHYYSLCARIILCGLLHMSKQQQKQATEWVHTRYTRYTC